MTFHHTGTYISKFWQARQPDCLHKLGNSAIFMSKSAFSFHIRNVSQAANDYLCTVCFGKVHYISAHTHLHSNIRQVSGRDPHHISTFFCRKGVRFSWVNGNNHKKLIVKRCRSRNDVKVSICNWVKTCRIASFPNRHKSLLSMSSFCCYPRMFLNHCQFTQENFSLIQKSHFSPQL